MLTTFQPVEILKNTFHFTGSNRFSRTLIIFQFATAVFLIACVVTMSKQLHFMKHKDLGLDKELVVDITIGDKYDVYRNEIIGHPGVVEVTSTSGIYTGGGVTFNITMDDGRDLWMRVLDVEANFLEALVIDLIEGRDFRQGSATDKTGAIIVNETFIKKYGLSVILYYRTGWNALVKITPVDITGTLAFLKKKWQGFFPNDTFRYRFVDEQIDQQYKDEQRWATIALSASILAVAIACMGLLGLATLTATRRTKEIGIRKVLGATVIEVVALLSKDFLKLVLLANLIAWPVAWFAMNKWLQNFAYRIDPVRTGWWVFALAGGLALVIALLTVSTQAIRVALANPVESLRYE